MKPKFEKDSTIGQMYGPAMEIIDPIEAKEYFEALVEHNMIVWGQTREEAEKIQHSNLGYYAGYYDRETQARVEKLFGSVHPIFGSVGSTEDKREQALEIGQELGKRLKK